jgi:predicted dehydrogenase
MPDEEHCMTIRIGLIGAGGIGEIHARAIQAAGSSLVAISDADIGRAQALAETCEGAVVHETVESLLADDSIQAVVLAVPNCLHSPLAVQALDAGRDVLLEKPMATSVAECDAVLAARDASKKILQIGFVSRLSATSMAARQVIESGRLGRIYHARATLYRRRGIPGLGRWFTTRSRSGGGVLIDLGPHLVDLLLHLCDRPLVESVDCHTTSYFGHPPSGYRFTDMWAGPPIADGPFDVEDGATALLRCEHDLTMSLNMSWASHLPEGTVPDGVTLFGDKGAMHFEILSDAPLIIGTEMDGAIVDITHPVRAGEDWTTAFRRQHERFARNVVSREAPSASGEDGREVQAVLEALYRSAEARSSVHMDEVLV